MVFLFLFFRTSVAGFYKKKFTKKVFSLKPNRLHHYWIFFKIAKSISGTSIETQYQVDIFFSIPARLFNIFSLYVFFRIHFAFSQLKWWLLNSLFKLCTGERSFRDKRSYFWARFSIVAAYGDTTESKLCCNINTAKRALRDTNIRFLF